MMLSAEGLLLTAYEVVPSGNLLGMKVQGFTAQTGFVPQLRSLQPLNSRPQGPYRCNRIQACSARL